MTTTDVKSVLDERASAVGLSRHAYLDRLIEAGFWIGPPDLLLEDLRSPTFDQRLHDGLSVAAQRRQELLREAAVRVLAHCMSGVAQMPPPELLARVRAPELREFAKDDQGELGALILGPSEVGKSIACAALSIRIAQRSTLDCISRNIANQNGPSQWRSSIGGIQFRRALDLGSCRQRHPLGEGDAPELLEVAEAKLAIIDDLGWEQPNRSEAVLEVIAKRYDAGVPTIVTSGLTHDRFRDRYGDAVIRRIIQTAGRQRPPINLHRTGAA